MRNMTLVIVSALMLPVVAQAQEAVTPWQQKLGIELLFNEGYYSSNWIGDERTSGSVTASLAHTAAKQLTGKLRFEHDLGLAYGRQLQRDSTDTRWESSKSDDRIRLDDLLRFTLGLWIDPLVSVQLKSQFVDGTVPPTKYLNPVELLETGGVGRKFYDDSARTLTSQVGAAMRQLFDARDTGGTVSDAGVSWITAFRTIVFSKDAEYTTRLVAYKPLFAFGSEEEIGTWPQFDWEHAISARFNKALSGKIYVEVLGESDKVDTGKLVTRFKQTLGLGLSLAWTS